MVKIGVMGCGYWGSKHVRNFHEIPEAELTMVCDLTAGRLAEVQAMYPTVAVTSCYDDLLDSDVDGVVIATPPSTHFPFAREALSRGKHVLVEKPFTTSSEAAFLLASQAESKGMVLMVGHTYEYNPAVEFLQDYVASGQLGDLYYIDSARLNLGLFQPDVDVVWDLAPHDLSIILSILGEDSPPTVSARGMAHIHPHLCEVAYLDLIFPRKVMAHIHVSWLDPCKLRRVTLVGSEKMVVFDDLSDSEPIRIYNKGVSIPSNGGQFNPYPVSYRHGEVFIPHIPRSEPLKLECRHFVECIRDGKRPRSDGWAGLRVVNILEQAQKSLHNGGTRVPPNGSPNVLVNGQILESAHGLSSVPQGSQWRSSARPTAAQP